jgi:LysR family transcriptional regulator, glycine cleavage system transcriptional activator
MPPLNALRAFETASRHESFAKAALELGVTPAAVSHQIKALEAWLGAALFIRHAQGLQLTDAGKSAMPAFAGAFDALGAAVQALRLAAPRARLGIAALPAVAQLWLAPRLPALRAAFPEVRPSIHALEAAPDFRREPFDLGFFFMREAGRGSRSFKLCDDRIFPVCTPKIAATLNAPAELARHPLLRDTSWADDWDRWLGAAGATGVPSHDGPAFSLYSLAVQAALDGAGILMAHEALVVAALKAGALVAPFPLRVNTGLRLELLAPDAPPGRTARLIDWFVAS